MTTLEQAAEAWQAQAMLAAGLLHGGFCTDIFAVNFPKVLQFLNLASQSADEASAVAARKILIMINGMASGDAINLLDELEKKGKAADPHGQAKIVLQHAIETTLQIPPIAEQWTTEMRNRVRALSYFLIGEQQRAGESPEDYVMGMYEAIHEEQL
jgi:hypothetical protein